ncbi:2-oxoglutarate dehydrogenase E1 component [hydrothermal vent metagenome]|uniref:oxoglutarate dehydrogenase (succinyl-transferring) n=1 Tax=hydrothermal vent metagenome TaxID=652676 RepID=A0A3B1BSQ1_9ZZZZ
MPMKELLENSYLFSANAPFVEAQYAEYLRDPDAVTEDWRLFFQELQQAAPGEEPDHAAIRAEFAHLVRPTATISSTSSISTEFEVRQVAVLQLINAYRFRGHQNADIDPLCLREKNPVPELDPAFHKLAEEDMDTQFNTGSLVGPATASLREILAILRRTYCAHIGVEYMHITDTRQKRWLQQRLEGEEGRQVLSQAEQRTLLGQLVAASEFEKYLHTRYVGQKRFSLEGAESLIPMLQQLLHQAGEHGLTEVVLGMAHRGRLNVLTNILGKSPASLFEEFEGTNGNADDQGSGDVKYHQGFSADIKTVGGIVHLALLFNPSHLEIIGPVVDGSVRARQHLRKDSTGGLVLPVLIHGDAAFSGQGVVMENFNMSQARGFSIGGTLHIIINNQIGFTTSNPLDSRSTTYCTEVARMIQAPILHVNGDDPEAVARVMRIALDFRMVYRKDVVVDLVCYRRHGHSEADEPAVTQPMMYRKIRQHSPVSRLYAEQLIEQGVLGISEVDELVSRYRTKLDAGETVAPDIMTDSFDKPYWVDWQPYVNADQNETVKTAIDTKKINALVEAMLNLPEALTVHKQVRRIFDERRKMAAGDLLMDWGFAETLAYASLVDEGYPVRLSGQDSGRGTFFHRHAIIHDQQDGSSYTPLQHLSKEQADFIVIDSLLSEEAVLAFEYGYSTAAPYSLVIWEAQFGDFANGAQVVIDQFITSGRAKWGRLSGLVMFLPHGFDGQGPEHSSARLERYLQLCAEDNIQVCVPSEPAQMFHLLRRQMLRKLRVPLILMTPKSLLRHKLSTSRLSELSEGAFQPVIADPDALSAKSVSRVIICAGKVFYDLYETRSKRAIENIAILRVEQLYPFPTKALREALAPYEQADHIAWCQEEPQNQGAWFYIEPLLKRVLADGQNLCCISRPASASPAVGYHKKHIAQLQALVDAALTITGNGGGKYAD